MARKLEKLVGENIFRLDDERIRETFGLSKIWVYYSFNNYNNDMSHINELKDEILRDYPDTKDEDIKVDYILDFESIRHARFTMLRVQIPVADFIRLRNENKISIL